MVICEFENGKKANLRHVTTGAVLVNKNGDVLLVKRADFLLEGGKWGIPGGYMDFDENVTTCIRREILEETGYESTDLALFRIISRPNRRNDDRQNVEFVFLAKAGAQVGEPDNESTDMRWFAPGDLPIDTAAFDHGEDLSMYLRHLEQPFDLPVFE